MEHTYSTSPSDPISSTGAGPVVSPSVMWSHLMEKNLAGTLCLSLSHLRNYFSPALGVLEVFWEDLFMGLGISSSSLEITGLWFLKKQKPFQISNWGVNSHRATTKGTWSLPKGQLDHTEGCYRWHFVRLRHVIPGHSFTLHVVWVHGLLGGIITYRKKYHAGASASFGILLLEWFLLLWTFSP